MRIAYMMHFRPKGPSINYVVSVGKGGGGGRGGSPKDDLLHRPYLIKRGGGQKLPILR